MNIIANQHVDSYYIFGRPTTKKNHSTIIRHASGKRMIISSKQFRKYQENALEQLAYQKRGKPPIDYHIQVRALYFFKDGRKADLINLEQATADILQRAGIVLNDELIRSWDGSRVLYRMIKNLVVIEIYRMEEEGIETYASMIPHVQQAF